MPTSPPLDADRFSHPLGTGKLTAALDFDGIPDDRYYTASDFNTVEDLGSGPTYHLSEDWNGEGDVNTDLGALILIVENGISSWQIYSQYLEISGLYRSDLYTSRSPEVDWL